MQKLFNNILVPIEFNKNAEPIIEEAAELARHFDCNIHLLYVIPEKVFARQHAQSDTGGGNAYETSLTQKISHLQHAYNHYIGAAQHLYTAVQKGSLENVIVAYTIKHHIDLVVLKKTRNSFISNWFRDLSINRLARKVRCPVLTLQTNVNLDSVKNIVLPVGTFLPVRKLMFATYLAKKYNSRLHLVALSNNHQQSLHKDDNVYLLKAYRLIRDNTEVPVECKSLNGHNIAGITLQYAKTVNADLIVINPGKESLLPGVISRIFTKFLYNESSIPVLTIASPAAK